MRLFVYTGNLPPDGRQGYRVPAGQPSSTDEELANIKKRLRWATANPDDAVDEASRTAASRKTASQQNSSSRDTDEILIMEGFGPEFATQPKWEELRNWLSEKLKSLDSLGKRPDPPANAAGDTNVVPCKELDDWLAEAQKKFAGATPAPTTANENPDCNLQKQASIAEVKAELATTPTGKQAKEDETPIKRGFWARAKTPAVILAIIVELFVCVGMGWPVNLRKLIRFPWDSPGGKNDPGAKKDQGHPSETDGGKWEDPPPDPEPPKKSHLRDAFKLPADAPWKDVAARLEELFERPPTLSPPAPMPREPESPEAALSGAAPDDSAERGRVELCLRLLEQIALGAKVPEGQTLTLADYEADESLRGLRSGLERWLTAATESEKLVAFLPDEKRDAVQKRLGKVTYPGLTADRLPLARDLFEAAVELNKKSMELGAGGKKNWEHLDRRDTFESAVDKLSKAATSDGSIPPLARELRPRFVVPSDLQGPCGEKFLEVVPTLPDLRRENGDKDLEQSKRKRPHTAWCIEPMRGVFKASEALWRGGPGEKS